MPSNHLILCRPLLPHSVFPSIRVFSTESVLRIRWPKYWSFSFSISPSNRYSGLICFRMDWLDLLAVQGTLKSLLQHHSLKAWILLNINNIKAMLFKILSVLFILKKKNFMMCSCWLSQWFTLSSSNSSVNWLLEENFFSGISYSILLTSQWVKIP